MQRAADARTSKPEPQPIQRTAIAGGLPERLKSGIESLSGMSMDHVRIHRNSAAPAKVGAHAFAQGSNIHLGPGQDTHLPHEAWHVVQQAQGRVAPTMQLKSVAINNDATLEREADVMGARASTGVHGRVQSRFNPELLQPMPHRLGPIQRVVAGFGNYRTPADIPAAWIAAYRRDLLNHQTHLELADIVAFVYANGGTMNDVEVIGNGAHFDLDIIEGRRRTRITIRPNGSCAAHTAFAILQKRHALQNTNNFAAPDAFVDAFRHAAARDIGDAQIRRTIVQVLHEVDSLAATGFGPRLIALLTAIAPAVPPPPSGGAAGAAPVSSSPSSAGKAKDTPPPAGHFDSGVGGVQDWMTAQHWSDQLDAEADRETKMDTFWDKVPQGGGTKRRLEDIYNDVGKSLLKQLSKAAPDSGQLRLYRGMDEDEAYAILSWFHTKKAGVERDIATSKSAVPAKDLAKRLKTKKNPSIMPIKGHMGDYEQAKYYSKRGVMLEFTLKPGAHRLLFDPRHMAVQHQGKSGTSQIFEAQRQTSGKLYPEATGNEGGLAGYVGVKSENHGDFSLTMGDSEVTHLLFQLMIASIRVVRR